MNSNIANSSGLRGNEKVDDLASLTRKLYELKTQIKAERVTHVTEKVAKNKCKFKGILYLADLLRTKEYFSKRESGSGDMLSYRMKNPLFILKSVLTYDLDSPDILVGPIKATAMLPFVEKIPQSVTWVPSDSNKLMAEDLAEDQPDEQKHQFSEAEKRMIRFVISQEYEPTEDVIQLLTTFIGGTTSEIHEAFTIIKTENEEMVNEDVTVPTGDQGQSKFLDNSLADVQDSFDALFCRQCLKFDCRRHMIRQPVITPAERAPSNFNPENERPCSDQCYLHLKFQDIFVYPERHTPSNGSEPAIIEETVWKRLEKDLCSVGQKIFGRNSCAITRCLNGVKTCIQVYKYMHAGQEGPSEACSTNDHEEPQSLIQRKNKAKRQKQFGKSVACRPTLRGSANGNRAKQYNPCDCKSGCGKDCPCLKSSNCCEKYCGCTKSCRNRYRGCYCIKSCRSQQCPCHVAGRECDPDVCRNCWVSYGGGALGEPERKGEGQCGNMRLLVKERKRVLMGRSDVAGWGIFLQRAADKDDLIGEYTGELISDEEADVRGNLYKEANTSSFLFNLNDQYVLDPIRTGSELKFANHSAKPNCYAKVLKVAGDDRLGIYAKKHIEAREEILYDYCYPNDLAPVWALKPDDPKEGPSAPQAKARKPPLRRSPLACPPLAPPSPRPPMDR